MDARQTQLHNFGPKNRSYAQLGWVFLLSITIVAGGFRFWRLGQHPPGLYRDEAYNGLDALAVLDGDHQLFFTNNNGREPLYIYLTAFSISLWGQTAWAVRFGAALVGTLTTYFVYLLGKTWFEESVGLFAAWLWAVTVWPIHLSRIGFRTILLVPCLACAAWLATLAWRRRHLAWSYRLWIAAGAVYGLSFYTYLAARLTPLCLLLIILYAIIKEREIPWRPIFWSALGCALMLSPFGLLLLNNPDSLLGRTGQVSILHPDINGGDLWGTLARHIGQTAGMFIWRGDAIIRHNPPGRPIFDPIMAIPFLIGVGQLLKEWRQSSSILLFIWIGGMAWGTILAEDAPHFLRAVGILPVALFPAAVGLTLIWSWPRLPKVWRQSAVILICVGSLSFTAWDYFKKYAFNPDTGYLFESAARELADSIVQNGQDRPENRLDLVRTERFIDQRLYYGWPSIQFLTQDREALTLFDPTQGWDAITAAVDTDTQRSIYLYPYVDTPANIAAQVFSSTQPGSAIDVVVGPAARNDLDPQPFQLYTRFQIDGSDPYHDSAGSPLVTWQLAAEPEKFDLYRAEWSLPPAAANGGPDTLHVTLHWQLLPLFNENEGEENDPARGEYIPFVHVLDSESGLLLGQSDAIPGQGFLPTSVWLPDRTVVDRHTIELARPFRSDSDQIYVGWYPSGLSENRLNIVDGERRAEPHAVGPDEELYWIHGEGR